MNPISDFSRELIDKYLLGTLTEEEKVLFEKEKQSPEFLQELVFQEQLSVAIRESGREALRQEIKSWKAETKKPRKLILSPWYYAAAAAIALIVAIVLIRQYSSPKTMAPEEIFAEAFTPYPNISNPVVRDADIPQDLRSQAFYFYEKGDYDQAARLFEKMGLANTDSVITFYRAVSLLANQDYQAAYEGFTLLRQQPEGRFYREAQWYLALTDLGLGRADQARQTLKTISGDDQHPFQQEAEELLEKSW